MGTNAPKKGVKTLAKQKSVEEEKSESDDILIDFFVAFASATKVDEVSLLISDLLTEREARSLARRLRIAVMLSFGYTYSDIKELMGVSSHTVSRVNVWLQLEGQGYKLAIDRLAKLGDSCLAGVENKREEESSPDKRHEKYTEAFWPVEVLGAAFKAIDKGRI